MFTSFSINESDATRSLNYDSAQMIKSLTTELTEVHLNQLLPYLSRDVVNNPYIATYIDMPLYYVMIHNLDNVIYNEYILKYYTEISELISDENYTVDENGYLELINVQEKFLEGTLPIKFYGLIRILTDKILAQNSWIVNTMLIKRFDFLKTMYDLHIIVENSVKQIIELKNKNAELSKQILILTNAINYAPDGPGYLAAKTHFESNVNNVDCVDCVDSVNHADSVDYVDCVDYVDRVDPNKPR